MGLWSLVALESDVLSSLGSHLHNLLCSLQIWTKKELLTKNPTPTHYSLKACSSVPSHSKTLCHGLLSPLLALAWVLVPPSYS